MLLVAIAVAKRFTHIELKNGFGEKRRRQYVRSYEYIVLGGSRRELVLEIIGGDVRDISLVAEETLPLLADGENADADKAHRASVGEREQVVANLFFVVKNNVSHIF